MFSVNLLKSARESFLWDNPNHAGAIIATLIPLIWLVEMKVHWSVQSIVSRIAFWIVDIFLIFTLLRTGSRGAGVAYIASAAIVFISLGGKQQIFTSDGLSLKSLGRNMMIRMTVAFRPHQRLNKAQRLAIEKDFGMRAGIGRIKVRKAMLFYTLAYLGLSEPGISTGGLLEKARNEPISQKERQSEQTDWQTSPSLLDSLGTVR